MKPGKLHTVSFDPVKKNPGKRLMCMHWMCSLSSGVWRELVWQVLEALLWPMVCPGHTVHPQSDQTLITVVGHSVDEPITRTLTC